LNIFYVDTDPVIAAQSLGDKHVIKMVLETAQLLSTAHHVLDGEDASKDIYKATHVNHPSAVWARATNNNYNWLFCHFIALLSEYTHRYGKIHKSSRLIDVLLSPPRNIPVDRFFAPPQCMPDEFKVEHYPVKGYRNYYRIGKKDLHKWTKREAPQWLNQ
jgi:hypothetical protein